MLGTVAGIDAITLDDVKEFAQKAYTRAALTVGVAGDVPDEFAARIKADVAKLPAGPALPAPAAVVGRRPSGIDVDIVKKETRSTAISFGFPIERHAHAPGLRGPLGRALPGSASTARPARTSTSASARCAA